MIPNITIFVFFAMSKIKERTERLKQKINAVCMRAGRDPDEVNLVVVTKSASIEAVEEVLRLGCTDLGENRAQQLRKVSAQADEFFQTAQPTEGIAASSQLCKPPADLLGEGVAGGVPDIFQVLDRFAADCCGETLGEHGYGRVHNRTHVFPHGDVR